MAEAPQGAQGAQAAELAAMVRAYDELVESSRALEQELEAEIAQLQRKNGALLGELQELRDKSSRTADKVGALGAQIDAERAVATARVATLESELSLHKRAVVRLENEVEGAEAKVRSAEATAARNEKRCDEALEALALASASAEVNLKALHEEQQRAKVLADEAAATPAEVAGDHAGRTRWVVAGAVAGFVAGVACGALLRRGHHT